MRYIGPMFFNAFNTLFPLNGLPASDVDAFPTTRFPAVMYHDLRVDFDFDFDSFDFDQNADGGAFKFYVGVDNVLDRGVPRGGATATGAGSAIYSFRGRSFYAGARARF